MAWIKPLAVLAAFVADPGLSVGAEEPIAPIEAPFPMPQLRRPVFPDRSMSIVDFGAVAGGVTLNENAFQRAIDACNAAGGGIVEVPAGRWLTTPIELKSNVNLHLDADAVVVFTDEKRWYFSEEIAARLKGITQHSGKIDDMISRPRPLISAYDCENIAITGKGKLDGQGVYWWAIFKKRYALVTHLYPPEAVERAWRGLDRSADHGRPPMFQPYQCRNVLMEGFTAVNSPFWFMNPVCCENVIARRLTIFASMPDGYIYTPNTDGVNPESCRNVLIEHCDITNGDDAIAIKSGVNELGRQRGRPSENIVIRHVRGRRFAIGSEMSASVRNVYIHDCEIFGQAGELINFKSRRGRGGVVENVWIRDITTGPVQGSIIQMSMYYGGAAEPSEPRAADEGTPYFRHIHFKNIAFHEEELPEAAVRLIGLGESTLEDITFENLDVTARHGLECEHVRGVTFTGGRIVATEAPAIKIDDGQDIRFSRVAFESDPGGPFIAVAGKTSGAIRFYGSMGVRDGAVELTDGAPEGEIRNQPESSGE